MGTYIHHLKMMVLAIGRIYTCVHLSFGRKVVLFAYLNWFSSIDRDCAQHK